MSENIILPINHFFKKFINIIIKFILHKCTYLINTLYDYIADSTNLDYFSVSLTKYLINKQIFINEGIYISIIYKFLCLALNIYK